jgi:type I restriction enzyme M protein
LYDVIEGENDKRKIAEKTVKAQMKKIGDLNDYADEYSILKTCIILLSKQTEIKKTLKTAKSELEDKIVAKYSALTETEIKVLVVDDKWMATLEQAVKGEMDRISQRLTQRIKELAERYEIPLPALVTETETLTGKVDAHLKKMGFIW